MIRCRGQILPLAVLLLAIGIAALALLVEVGRATNAKLRATHAADAAAYTAALVEARALNHHALTNRAIVANQVSIAQTLALVSWAGYFADFWTREGAVAGALASMLPVRDGAGWSRYARLVAVLAGAGTADVATGGQASAAFRAQVLPVVNEIGAVAITAFDAASSSLAASQVVIEAALAPGGTARIDAVRGVVGGLDAHMRADVLEASSTYPSLLSRRAGGDRARLADVVVASLDPFTSNRDWTLVGGLTSNRLERRGGTRLADLDHWRSDDSLTFYRRSLTWRGWRTTTSSLADSRVTLGPDAATSSTRHAPSYRWPFDEARFSGLPATVDLRDPSDRNPGSAVSVIVRKPVGSALVRVAGAPMPDVTTTALARAETYFERNAARADGRAESASAFNPYWRARLVPVTALDLADARRETESSR